MSPLWEAALVSVVVPTYNRAATLARVLEAFATQTLPAERFEVLVIDDGSTDATPQVVAAAAGRLPYALSLHQQANQGPAAARNRGLRAARGEVVVFIDDDCVPTPGLLAAHRAAHEVEGVAAIGRIVWHPDLSITPFMRYLERSIFGYEHIPLYLDATFICYYTGNASVHRASALAIDGFDASFARAMHEDIDFAYRLRRQGTRIVFAPSAEVHHLRPADLVTTLRNQRDKGREFLHFWRRHPELHEFTPLPRLSDPTVTAEAQSTLVHAAHASGLDHQAAEAPGREWWFGLPDALPSSVAVPEPRLSALLDEKLRLTAEILWSRASVQSTKGLRNAHLRLTATYADQSTISTRLAAKVEAVSGHTKRDRVGMSVLEVAILVASAVKLLARRHLWRIRALPRSWFDRRERHP